MAIVTLCVPGYSDRRGSRWVHDHPRFQDTQDGHSYSGVLGQYSDHPTRMAIAGGYMIIPGSTQDGHSYSGVLGYSDKG